MATDEFSLIRRYFSAIGKPGPYLRLGIGDDAAVCAIPPQQQLVMTIDTLNGGVHFLPDTAPADIAHKALAVNLSDLAAMAADPAWFLMSLSLPEADDAWLEQFAAGLASTAEQFDVQLIGGDTCRGPLSVTIQINGLVPEHEYVTRAGARPGDLVVVSGSLGDAALGLAQLQGKVELPDDVRDRCVNALLRPTPRIELVPYLRRFATAAIDISDGLQADLGHVLEASACGALLERDRLPVNGWIKQYGAYDYALGGGDDYEICCCISADHEDSVADWNRQAPDCPLTVIGEIRETGYRLRQPGEAVDLQQPRGYRHFD
jgi:thiamine-monophosphate kinase